MPVRLLQEAQMALGELTVRQRDAVQRAVDLAREISGRCFAAYVGPLPEGRDSALARHAMIPDAESAVLIALDPQARTIHVVTGTEAAMSIYDRTCEMAVLTLKSSLQADDLVGGIRAAVTLLADHSRSPVVLNLDEPA